DSLRDEGIVIDAVVELKVDDEEIVQRMSGRRVHPESGRVYHVVHNPPKEEGKDDVTGEPIVQRDDDREDTVRKRLQVYHEQTKPLVEYYSALAEKGGEDAPRYVAIDGTGSVDDVQQRIRQALGS
ncbi:MAG: nucleoside monophosphate kinase, partial [Ectothiorhodospiraceae bacterium]